MTEAHFSLMAKLFLETDQEAYQEFHLIVLFEIILADKLFGKSLRRLTTSLLVDNNNVCGKPSPH